MLLKKLIKNFDMFAAPPLLRVKGEPESTNICAGLCSIAVALVFTVIFIFSLISLLNYQEIQAKDILKDTSEQIKIKDIVFSIGMDHINLWQRTDILTTTTSIFKMGPSGPQFIELPMVPCTAQMWSQAENYEYFVDLYQITQAYCPDTTNQQVYGGFYGAEFSFIFVSVSICNNFTSPVPCADSATINTFLQDIVTQNKYLNGKIFMLSTIFDVTSQQATKKSINKQAFWLPVTLEQKMEILIELGTYEVKTDTSFFPWKTESIEEGYFLDATFFANIFIPSGATDLIQGAICSTTTRREVEREYGKIDDTLSYIGGLFGILMSFFAFFMMSFNEYRYELAVAEGSMNEKFQDGKNIGQDHMTFTMYIKYTVYDWLKMLFGCQLNWKDCKRLQEAREQGASQIDVEFLLKRINHLEQINQMKISEPEESIFGLVENVPLKKVKKRRRIQEYKSAILQGRVAMSINTINIMDEAVKKLSIIGNFFQARERSSLDELVVDSEINLNQPANDSFRKVRKYLRSEAEYLKQFEKEIPELDEDLLEVEKELAQDFKEMTEEVRMNVIKKIPLPILYRLFKQYEPKILEKDRDESMIDLTKDKDISFTKVSPRKKVL